MAANVPFDPLMFRSYAHFVGNHADADAQLHGQWNIFGAPVPFRARSLYGHPEEHAVPVTHSWQRGGKRGKMN